MAGKDNGNACGWVAGWLAGWLAGWNRTVGVGGRVVLVLERMAFLQQAGGRRLRGVGLRLDYWWSRNAALL